jgi:hypothetical protein
MAEVAVDVLTDRREPKRSLPEKKPPSCEVVLPERERKDQAGDAGRGGSGCASRCPSRVRGRPEGDRLCEDGDGADGCGVGDFPRLCVIRRSKPAHFPNLRIRYLTWSLRGAQNPYPPPPQNHSAQKTSWDCTALLDLGIVDIRQLVYPNACQGSRQLRAVTYFAGHGREVPQVSPLV